MTAFVAVRSRGVALLLVFGAVLVVSVAAMGIVRNVAVSNSAARTMRDVEIADDLLRASDAWLRMWIAEVGPSVVLAPDARVPGVDVGSFRGSLCGREFAVSALAFDQDAMVSPRNVREGGGALNQAIDKDVLTALARYSASHAETDLTGLDQIEFGQRFIVPRGLDEPALATKLALPEPRLARININTAPIERIVAVYRALGVSGVEQIVDARSRGERVTTAPPIAADALESGVAMPVVESTSWAIRLDLQVGPIKRAWWCVYRAAGRALGRGGFTCIQRIAIDE